ncbi:MAG: spermidine synthase, partial [Pseudomonadota bacterium]|nr:spermidine synthase [Pseudomonadota bacterium]
NLFGHARGFKASTGRISEAFAGRSIVFPSLDSGNAIAIAAEGRPVEVSLPELRTRAAALKAATALDLRPTITRLQLTKSLPGGILQL